MALLVSTVPESVAGLQKNVAQCQKARIELRLVFEDVERHRSKLGCSGVEC